MIKEPQISTIYAQIIINYLEHNLSAPVDELLGRVFLDRPTLFKENEMIPYSKHIALTEQAAVYVNDPNFGLHVASKFELTDLGLYGYLLVNSDTLLELYQNVVRYHKLTDDCTQFKLIINNQMAHLCVFRNSSLLPYSRQDVEYILMDWIVTFRLLAGQSWRPDEVHFKHSKPEDIDEHKRLMCFRLLFDQPENKLVFDTDILNCTQSNADTKLGESIRIIMDQMLLSNDAAANNQWVNSVQGIIINSLPNGLPRIQDVAIELNMTARTLRRKLSDEGYTYQGVLDDILKNLSISYLSLPNLSIIDITILIGYSEISAFSRAFLRWTGYTPSDYRQKYCIEK